MKNIALSLFYLLCTCCLFSQDTIPEKIKIVLLGTVHFEPSNVDMYKNKALNVFSDKRQQEIKQVVKEMLER